MQLVKVILNEKSVFEYETLTTLKVAEKKPAVHELCGVINSNGKDFSVFNGETASAPAYNLFTAATSSSSHVGLRANWPEDTTVTHYRLLRYNVILRDGTGSGLVVSMLTSLV